MAAIRAGFSDLLAPGFLNIFRQNQDIKQYPEEYSKYLKVEGSDRQFEEENIVTGFGSAMEKEERASVQYDDPFQGTKKRYTHITYALGFRISEELWEDDLYGAMKAMPGELSFSLRDVTEVVSAGILINGFTDSAAYRGPDGEPLFGDGTTKDHPLLGGGRAANQLSVASDLNVDSLEALLILMADTVNDQGLLAGLKGRLLIVPTELQFQAKQLLESELEAYVANNQVNPFDGMDLKYFVGHYLTDPDAFFLQAQKHYMKHLWRKRAAMANDDDFDTGDAKFKGRQRSINGYTDWRGISASPGA